MLLPEPEEVTEEMKQRCTCDEYEWEEHTCPYSEEINDSESLCTCCPFCTQECADDI